MSKLYYDPFMREVVEGDPYPLYETLRSSSPRLYLDKYQAWFFSTFDDVWNLLKLDELSVANGITPTQLLLGGAPNNFMVSQMDPPEHSFYRSALNTIFKPSAAQSLERDICIHAQSLLQILIAQGGGDLLMDYATPLAVGVGCTLSGLPHADIPLLLRWTNHFFHREPGRPGDTAVGGRAAMEFIEYIKRIVGDVKSGKVPAAGALGLLLEEQKSNRNILDEHIHLIVLNLQIGAGDTVPKSIAAAFYRLWNSPDQLHLLQEKPTSSLQAFLEAVRIDMPTQMQGRVATTSFHFDGTWIEQGQKVMFLFASANRDSNEFPNPNAYLIERANRRTLGFGNGIHRCLGVHVAQIEGRIALEQAMAMLPPFEIDLPASYCHKTEYVKGWAHLPIKL